MLGFFFDIAADNNSPDKEILDKTIIGWRNMEDDMQTKIIVKLHKSISCR